MSVILAIDQSTLTGSVAVMNERRVLAERTWIEKGNCNQQFFAILPPMLAEASVDVGDIDLLAVGLGPGAFAGLRMSISTARAWALPDGKPVYGVSSGEAIAADTITKTGSSSVIVVGDARRNRLWYAQFDITAGQLVMTVPYALLDVSLWPSVLKKDVVVVTPHWDRIGEMLSAHSRKVTLLKGEAAPRAQTIAGLVLDRLERKQSIGELKPIYLHPPVFVEPRYSVSP
jgi:tRNA threonylcarbamoyladenosine biosynthesis protein TsaB